MKKKNVREITPMFAVNSEGQPPNQERIFFLSSPRGLKSGPQSRFNFTFKKERTLRSKFVADKNDGPLPRIRLALESIQPIRNRRNTASLEFTRV